MSAYHRTHRADENQARIVKRLRQIGATVEILSQVGNGCPDLLVGISGSVNVLLEVKQPGGKLSEAQEEWHRKWAGQRAVVHDEFEAIAVINEINRRRRAR